jgi:hypothetical protein
MAGKESLRTALRELEKEIVSGKNCEVCIRYAKTRFNAFGTPDRYPGVENTPKNQIVWDILRTVIKYRKTQYNITHR